MYRADNDRCETKVCQKMKLKTVLMLRPFKEQDLKKSFQAEKQMQNTMHEADGEARKCTCYETSFF